MALTAFAPGICVSCGDPILVGSQFNWGSVCGTRVHHPACGADSAAALPISSSRSEPVVDASVNWSPLQQAIFDFIKTQRDSLIIQAVAGSGKTTTIVEAAKLLPIGSKSIFIAFNKKIVETLEGRLPESIPTATFNAFCYRTWRGNRHVKVEDTKVNVLTRKVCRTDDLDEDAYFQSVTKLVALAKSVGIGLLVPDSEDSWEFVIERYGIDVADSSETLIETARKVLSLSNADRSVIDFNDQLWFPLLDNTPFPKFDAVFIDESQDTNAVQRALLHRMLLPGGRLIAVGDRNQAIYGFRGADSKAMDMIQQEFDCVELPLSISYRCPQAVVRAAQKIVPGIAASPDAPEGEVNWLGSWNLDIFKPKDAILCRNTAPLISLAYRLIGERIPCTVLGRDIGKGLTALIKKLRPTSITDLEAKLTDFRNREVVKLVDNFQDAKAQALDDKIDSIFAAISALGEEQTIPTLIASIESLFSEDKGNHVLLSTVHKSKGDEWDRVFILNPELMPSKWARQVWQQDQERNLQYVAYTRAKQSLNFISDGKGSVN